MKHSVGFNCLLFFYKSDLIVGALQVNSFWCNGFLSISVLWMQQEGTELQPQGGKGMFWVLWVLWVLWMLWNVLDALGALPWPWHPELRL